MLYKELGTTGIKIPALGLGTWKIGGGNSADRSRDREYVEVLKKAIDMGYSHLDTAEMYGDGHAEELIGEAIKGLDREELFLVSKVYPWHLERAQLERAIQGSLKRLGTDYIDLYLIHWYTSGAPLGEALETMSRAVEEGTLRYIGVSNFDTGLLRKSMELSPAPITCNQVLYNIEDRGPETGGLLEFCQREGVTLTAYSPLGEGHIGRRYRPVLQEIAKDHDATPYQVILAWLLSKDRVVAIPKSAQLGHIRENLETVELRLSREEVGKLDGQG